MLLNIGNNFSEDNIPGQSRIETFKKWVTRALVVHIAVCLRDSRGKLWVMKVGHENGE